VSATVRDLAVQEPRTVARRRRRPAVAGYAFLLPWLLGFFGLTLGPALASLYLSFTSYDLMEAPRWIGLANYVRILTALATLATSHNKLAAQTETGNTSGSQPWTGWHTLTAAWWCC